MVVDCLMWLFSSTLADLQRHKGTVYERDRSSNISRCRNEISFRSDDSSHWWRTKIWSNFSIFFDLDVNFITLAFLFSPRKLNHMNQISLKKVLIFTPQLLVLSQLLSKVGSFFFSFFNNQQNTTLDFFLVVPPSYLFRFVWTHGLPCFSWQCLCSVWFERFNEHDSQDNLSDFVSSYRSHWLIIQLVSMKSQKMWLTPALEIKCTR